MNTTYIWIFFALIATVAIGIWGLRRIFNDTLSAMESRKLPEFLPVENCFEVSPTLKGVPIRPTEVPAVMEMEEVSKITLEEPITAPLDLDEGDTVIITGKPGKLNRPTKTVRFLRFYWRRGEAFVKLLSNSGQPFSRRVTDILETA